MEGFKDKFLREEDNKFAPHSDLKEKRNYTRHIFVNQDGSIFETVRLNILNDRHREEIIGFHFAQQYAKIYYGGKLEQPHFYIVSRDNPWDIEYVMHDGTSFFLEICRVADEDLLRAIKLENDINLLLSKPALKGYEIDKIEKQFPGTLPADLVAKVKTKADRKLTFNWQGPREMPRIFVRPPMAPFMDLKNAIKIALEKKASKKHAGKERTT